MTPGPLDDLGPDLPVLVAPMAGGPTTTALVVAAARAGSLAFLAAGYRTPEDLAGDIAAVRAATPRFGVNVFAPRPVPVDPASFRSYAERLRPVADALGVELAAGRPVEDDDDWAAKIDLLVSDPVPLVSFTFGLPGGDTVRRLRRGGTAVVQTVTSPAEARAAEEVEVDLLAVQAADAGGHRGVFDPSGPADDRGLAELVRAVRAVTSLPLVGAGGVAGPHDVVAALDAGAVAVMAGTAFLRADEAGTAPPVRAALAGGDRPTVVTRAFTGRPARGLANAFTARFDGVAPFGYPALHHLTSPLRRAAVAAGDAEWTNLWAGSGYRAATEGPLAALLDRIVDGEDRRPPPPATTT